ELDPHQHVQGLQPNGLHREEDAREDPGRLGAQELTPRRTAPGSRAQPAAAKQGGNRGGRHPDPQLEQFPPDALIASPGVLSSKAKGALLQLRPTSWWPGWPDAV